MLYTIIDDDENGMNMEMLKMAYKNFYSTFDKIAMFLSNYIDIRLKSYEIDFCKDMELQEWRHTVGNFGVFTEHAIVGII